MNTALTDFTVPLTLEPHHQAEQFRKHQTSSQKAKQIYLNTLAIYATRFYLECLGYKPDLAASDGLNPLQQMLLGSSALAVKGCGQLECLPVVDGNMELEIAPELQCDRIGYVAVHIDNSLRTATLLGFVTEAADRVSLSQLQPMENLSGLFTPNLGQQASEQITQLSRWLQNLADEGWQTLDSLVNPATLAFRNQAIESPEPMTVRSKCISLNEHSITLAVGLLPLSDAQTEIQVQVYAAQTYLPPRLKLSVLDIDNQEVMQAEARATESIQLKFTGSPGEQFSLKLALQNASVSERFEI
ncbi:MAG: DUF1822 family protein [Cyanobacteria bacterium P01_B01_bin.77]